MANLAKVTKRFFHTKGKLLKCFITQIYLCSTDIKQTLLNFLLTDTAPTVPLATPAKVQSSPKVQLHHQATLVTPTLVHTVPIPMIRTITTTNIPIIIITMILKITAVAISLIDRSQAPKDLPHQRLTVASHPHLRLKCLQCLQCLLHQELCRNQLCLAKSDSSTLAFWRSNYPSSYIVDRI